VPAWVFCQFTAAWSKSKVACSNENASVPGSSGVASAGDSIVPRVMGSVASERDARATATKRINQAATVRMT
jgi:hypothetical protein